MIGLWAWFLDFLPALFVLAAVWIVGVWYGLYLNLTHMHRMRLYACRIADALDKNREVVK